MAPWPRTSSMISAVRRCRSADVRGTCSSSTTTFSSSRTYWCNSVSSSDESESLEPSRSNKALLARSLRSPSASLARIVDGMFSSALARVFEDSAAFVSWMRPSVVALGAAISEGTAPAFCAAPAPASYRRLSSLRERFTGQPPFCASACVLARPNWA